MIFADLFNHQLIGFLDVKDSTELWYRNSDTKMIAKGNKEDMEKLKELKKELFNNRDLKGIIEEYKTLYDNLVRDVYKRQLWNDLMKLYSDIKGGMSLEGYEACHLCPPRPS
jgi:hypothetical protein